MRLVLQTTAVALVVGLNNAEPEAGMPVRCRLLSYVNVTECS